MKNPPFHINIFPCFGNMNGWHKNSWKTCWAPYPADETLASRKIDIILQIDTGQMGEWVSPRGCAWKPKLTLANSGHYSLSS